MLHQDRQRPGAGRLGLVDLSELQLVAGQVLEVEADGSPVRPIELNRILERPLQLIDRNAQPAIVRERAGVLGAGVQRVRMPRVVAEQVGGQLLRTLGVLQRFGRLVVEPVCSGQRRYGEQRVLIAAAVRGFCSRHGFLRGLFGFRIVGGVDRMVGAHPPDRRQISGKGVRVALHQRRGLLELVEHLL